MVETVFEVTAEDKEKARKELGNLIEKGILKDVGTLDVESQINYYRDHEFDKEKVKDLIKQGRENGSLDFTTQLANIFLENYNTDTEWEWPYLIRRYVKNPRERFIIDRVFVDLCGWSLAKMIKDSVNLCTEG